MKTLHIGDSGWRAITTDGFTFERLSAIVAALTRLYPRQKAVIGFDNRFLSEDFGHHVAFMLREKGWKVRILPRLFSTPGVAWLVRQGRYDWGLMITASHNPYYYNGLKIFNRHGALMDRASADRVAAEANRILKKLTGPDLGFRPGRRFEAVLDVEKVRRRYLGDILKRVDVRKIRKSGLRAAWDGFGGVTMPLFPMFLDALKIKHHAIPMVEEPTYGGRKLEPDAESLQGLSALVRRTRSHIGLATDVDGDRFSIVDERGRYVSNNLLASLMVWYLLHVRRERGTVYQTISCSDLTKRMCEEAGVSLKVVPVGFQAMGRLMIADAKPLVGIEETGGLAYGPHLPLKDGLMTHALILEMLVSQKKTLSVLIERLHRSYGFYHYRRSDLKLTSAIEAMHWLKSGPWEKALGEKIRETSLIDGVKWTFASGGWVLIRHSKTEPLLRIYCESLDRKFVNRVTRYVNGK